ncbi:MAG: hypothetical protein ACK5KT_11210 [Dysgonomonas sp.]
MKKLIRSFVLMCIFIALPMVSCCDKFYGEPFGLMNNSDNRVYFWYDSWDRFKLNDFIPNFHYPDTVLPVQIPPDLNKYISLSPHNGMVVSEADPDWKTIYSRLPAGKLSVYFFPILPETQEQWDSIKENRVYTRKDVTYDELVSNGWSISYP